MIIIWRYQMMISIILHIYIQYCSVCSFLLLSFSHSLILLLCYGGFLVIVCYSSKKRINTFYLLYSGVYGFSSKFFNHDDGPYFKGKNYYIIWYRVINKKMCYSQSTATHPSRQLISARAPFTVFNPIQV